MIELGRITAWREAPPFTGPSGDQPVDNVNWLVGRIRLLDLLHHDGTPEDLRDLFCAIRRSSPNVRACWPTTGPAAAASPPPA